MVFLDSLVPDGLPGEARTCAYDSVAALHRIIETCARVGTTGGLQEHYYAKLGGDRALRPHGALAAQKLARLRELGKLEQQQRGRSRCDEQTREFRAFGDDAFLLHDAAATGATWILTRDPRLPRGWWRVPLRGGGAFEVFVADPQLVA
jgi:hypothetical protein